MWSSMPNLSTVGLTVWPPIEYRHTDTHTHSHLYYVDEFVTVEFNFPSPLLVDEYNSKYFR